MLVPIQISSMLLLLFKFTARIALRFRFANLRHINQWPNYKGHWKMSLSCFAGSIITFVIDNWQRWKCASYWTFISNGTTGQWRHFFVSHGRSSCWKRWTRFVQQYDVLFSRRAHKLWWVVVSYGSFQNVLITIEFLPNQTWPCRRNLNSRIANTWTWSKHNQQPNRFDYDFNWNRMSIPQLGNSLLAQNRWMCLFWKFIETITDWINNPMASMVCCYYTT